MLATRHLKAATRPALPEPIRRLVIQFMNEQVALDLAGASTNIGSIKWQTLCPVADQRINKDYETVLCCYLDKIHNAAKAGKFDEFLITEEVAHSVPALTNGDRPRIDIVVAMLCRKDFAISRADGERISRFDVRNRRFGDLSLPLRIDLSQGNFGHADKDANTVARHAVQGTGGQNAGVGEVLGYSRGSAWKSFTNTVENGIKEVADYLIDRLGKAAAKGVAEIVVTPEMMAEAPKLPSGEHVPLNPAQMKALHPALPRGGLLDQLMHRSETDGFKLRFRERGRDWYSNGEPLPFTMRVGYFFYGEDEPSGEEEEEAEVEED